MGQKKEHWKCRRKRWWIGLLIFWFVAGGGAGLMARSGILDVESASPGFITTVMLIFVIFAAVTDRGRWNVPVRIVWVIGLWLFHALLSVEILLTFGPNVPEDIINNQSNPFYLDRYSNLFAASPIIMWAMRRSKLVVELVSKQQVENTSERDTL